MHPDAIAQRRLVTRLFSMLVSAALLYVLYRSMDFTGVGLVLRNASLFWLPVSIGMIVPITVMRAARFRWLVPDRAVSGLWEATKITLVASAFNLFLPAKTGDFAKSVFVARRGGTTPGIAVAVVVYERLSDIAGMVFWGLSGLVLAGQGAAVVPPVTWVILGVVGVLATVAVLSQGMAEWSARAFVWIVSRLNVEKAMAFSATWPMLHAGLRGRRAWLAVFSILLWLLQLSQIWLFAMALSADISFARCASVSAIALIIAQIPITFGGIGARDIALVYLMAAYISPEVAAAIGILTTTRTLLPALAALPFLRSFLDVVVTKSEV